MLALYMAVVSHLDYQYYKAAGQQRGSTVKEELPAHSRSDECV